MIGSQYTGVDEGYDVEDISMLENSVLTIMVRNSAHMDHYESASKASYMELAGRSNILWKDMLYEESRS